MADFEGFAPLTNDSETPSQPPEIYVEKASRQLTMLRHGSAELLKREVGVEAEAAVEM